MRIVRLALIAFAPKLVVAKEGPENHEIIKLSLVVVFASLPVSCARRVVYRFLGDFSGDGHSARASHPFFYLRI